MGDGIANLDGSTWATSIGFETAKRTAESCIEEELKNLHNDCLKKADGQQNSEYYECRVEKRQDAIRDCDQFAPLQTALELVFGSHTSPGFICGIKDAVVNDGVPMPGTCCLDAPYELDGKNWGQPVSEPYLLLGFSALSQTI